MAGSSESFKRQPELNSAENLKAKIEKMAGFWKAGFGNNVAGIVASARVYVECPKIELKKHNLHHLRLIEKVYEKIPFSTLDKDAKEFKPIFEVNSLVPVLREESQKFYKNPNYHTVGKIFLVGKHIANLGRLYDKYIHDSISQLRKIKGYEDYTIEVEHIEKTREEVIKERGHLRRLGNRNLLVEKDVLYHENKVLESRRELQDYVSGMKTGKSGKTK